MKIFNWRASNATSLDRPRRTGSERRAEWLTFRHAALPYCHWCRKKTVLLPGRAASASKAPLRATVDHLIDDAVVNTSRKKFRDQLRKDRETAGLWVLSCAKCNTERSTTIQKSRIKAHLLKLDVYLWRMYNRWVKRIIGWRRRTTMAASQSSSNKVHPSS